MENDNEFESSEDNDADDEADGLSDEEYIEKGLEQNDYVDGIYANNVNNNNCIDNKGNEVSFDSIHKRKKSDKDSYFEDINNICDNNENVGNEINLIDEIDNQIGNGERLTHSFQYTYVCCEKRVDNEN